MAEVISNSNSNSTSSVKVDVDLSLLSDQLRALLQQHQQPHPQQEEEVSRILTALSVCDMTVTLLLSTGIGVLVNQVKKQKDRWTTNTHIQQQCNQLLHRWKQTSRQERQTETETDRNRNRDTTNRKRKTTETHSSTKYFMPDVDSNNNNNGITSVTNAFNPNLAYYDEYYYKQQHQQETREDTTYAEEHDGESVPVSSSALSIDSTSRIRSRKFVEDVFDQDDDESVSPSSSSSSSFPCAQPIVVCSLLQMCIDALSHPVALSTVTILSIPAVHALTVLKRATVDQLRRIESFNPGLKEDADCLWQEHVRTRFADETDIQQQYNQYRQSTQSGKLSASCWRAFYQTKLQQKEEKLTEIQGRLKQRYVEERAARAASSTTKKLDSHTVNKQMRNSNSTKHKQTSALGKGNGSNPRRLSLLRKHSSSLSRRLYKH